MRQLACQLRDASSMKSQLYDEADEQGTLSAFFVVLHRLNPHNLIADASQRTQLVQLAANAAHISPSILSRRRRIGVLEGIRHAPTVIPLQDAVGAPAAQRLRLRLACDAI